MILRSDGLVVSSVRFDGLDFVKFRIDTLSVNQEKKGLKLLDRFLQVLFVELECFDLWNANMIRLLVDSYNKLILVIMEIPSKEEPAHDFVLLGVKYLFPAESMASRRH